MSFEYQLEKHLEDAPAEPSIPACLDESLRVQEWEEFYPSVQVPPNFFSSVADRPAELIQAILDEHSRSAEFRESNMEDIEVCLGECVQRLEDLPSPDGLERTANAHWILEDVEQLNLEMCLLEKFTNTCRDCFGLYLHQISPQTLYPFRDRVADIAARIQSDKPRVSRFIEQLSKIYDDLRAGGKKKKVEATVGTSFVRKSIKYWIHPDNLTEVKCHVLRHLPLFAFPNKDGSPHNPAITSIYYDNDNLDLYSGRLLKQDEAIALRIRWYGVTEQPLVYVENKIHYEDWTGEPSTKSRFALEEGQVNPFMAGNFTLDNKIKELISQKKLARKEIDAMDTLAKFVQKAVSERELKPMMRTFYNRTAFQLTNSARVRVSIDEELTFVREDDRVVGRKLANGGMDKNWRRRDVGIDWPFERLPENEIHHFPYAVLEVKLQTETGSEPPLWVRELMQSQLVEEAPKFSKFVHGCVSLLEPLTPMHPYWLYQMSTDIRHRRQHTLLELTRTTVDVPWDPAMVPAHPYDGRRPSWRHMTAMRTPLNRQPVSIEKEEVPAQGNFSFLAFRRSAPVAPMGVDEKVPEPADKEKAAPPSSSGSSGGGKAPSGAGAALAYLPPKVKKLMRPMVVEPKVHFANERTFLGWTHYSLFLINGATAVIAFTAGFPELGTLRAGGIVICVLGLLFLLIGLHVRDVRQRKISWNPEAERIDAIVPLIIMLGTITIAVAINLFAAYSLP